ncbi:MAG: asparagine synthase-related protein [Candidatus Bipolaricaulota bacterium]
MSAIAGIVGKKARPKDVGRMLNEIRHRGPDNSVVRNLPYATVGCGEINTSYQATFAFSGEQQPFVLMDGDVFNHRPYETTNATFLRSMYEKHGMDCFAKLDGSYACAVIEQDQTLLVRDPVGSRPLVYGTKDGQLYFASEAKALVDFLPEVKELPAGHIYSSRDGLKPFALERPHLPEFETPAEAAKALREVMVEAVEKMMADGAAEGVSLSGGLDSSLIAAIAKQFNRKLKVFSTTIKRYPGQDLGYAKLMANYLGLEHHIYRITDEDIARILPRAVWFLESFDEDCISGFIANYYSARMAREHTNCVLVGEGADELFGGYFRELQAVDDPEEKEKVAQKLVAIAYNTALRRLDRGWMSNSVDYRAPFLDAKVVTLSERIPLAMKVYAQDGEQIEKWILREAFRDMLPREISNRPKLRFARGTGVDDLMDQLIASKVGAKDMQRTPKSSQGVAFTSPKELHYYRLFRKRFPSGYEGLTVRWDPFK